MLKLSKKVEYGLIALLHMDSLAGSHLATAKDVAEHYHIPAELLGKVLQALTRGELVESVQGAKGGYRLLRPLDRMSLGDVIEAVEGPVHLARCQDAPESCEQFCLCNIREPVFEIQSKLTEFVHEIDLAAFRQSQQAGRATAETGLG